MRTRTILSATIALAALGACGGGSGAPPTGTVSESATGLRKVPQSDNPYTLFETLQVRPLALSASGCSTRRTRPTTGSRSSASTRQRPSAGRRRSRSGSSRSRSRVRAERRSVGRQPPLRLGEHRRRRRLRQRRASCNTLLVGDEPRDIVFAGPNARPRVHHDRAPRPELARRSRPLHARRRPRRRLGLRREQPRRGARRDAAHEDHALRRHAARARRVARRQDGLRGRVLLGQPDDDRVGGRGAHGLRRA